MAAIPTLLFVLAGFWHDHVVSERLRRGPVIEATIISYRPSRDRSSRNAVIAFERLSPSGPVRCESHVRIGSEQAPLVGQKMRIVPYPGSCGEVILAGLLPLAADERTALEEIQPTAQPESEVRRLLELAYAAFLGLGAARFCVIALGRLVPQAIRTGEWQARGTTYHRPTTPIRFWLALVFVSALGILSGCTVALLAFTIPAHL